MQNLLDPGYGRINLSPEGDPWERHGRKVSSGSGLVGIWDFAGGTFDVEDQNGKLFLDMQEISAIGSSD